MAQCRVPQQYYTPRDLPMLVQFPNLQVATLLSSLAFPDRAVSRAKPDFADTVNPP